MYQIYDCIAERHDPYLLLLAVAICAVGCLTALSLLARARDGSSRRSTRLWLGAAAFVAGAAIWSTHFVAMLAFQPGMPLGYDLDLTALSIALGMSLSWVGFAIALRYRTPASGGAVFGAAICAMHYTGIAALRVPAHLHWNAGFAHASLVIAILFGAAALRVFAGGSGLRRRIAATGLMMLAIAGLHFTAMTALSFEYDPLVATSGVVLAPEWLAIAVATVMVTVIVLGLAGSVLDQHLAERTLREAVRLRAHVAELQATKRQLEAAASSLESALAAAAAGSQAKSQFLATMSHELRTPLNAVIGFSEILAAESFGPLGDDRYKDYAKSICDSGRHLLDLINDVLDFSKVDAGHLELQEEVLDLREIASAALRMIAGHADAARVRVTDQLAPDLPLLRADPRRVRQVLLNLLSNAVKFTPEGGEIRISGSRTSGGLAIAVTDTGIGIAAEDIPRALERFGQIDNALSRKYAGSGLGLPLSQRLMALHGGTLDLESEVGTGTVVTIGFPAFRLVEDHQAAA
jgi:signal transduction histidine kinase